MTYDMTDPRTIPADVREAAFHAAMLTVARVTTEHGYPLDAIAELELVDLALAAIRDGHEDEEPIQ